MSGIKGYILAFIVALGIVLGSIAGVYFFIIKPRQESHELTIQNDLAGARTDSGSTATQTVNQRGLSESAVDKQVQEAHHDIQATSGAHVKVAPDTNRAGLRALCMRNAYRDSPRCRGMLKSRP